MTAQLSLLPGGAPAIIIMMLIIVALLMMITGSQGIEIAIKAGLIGILDYLFFNLIIIKKQYK